MNIMEYIILVVGILCLILGIYTTWQFSKGVSVSALRSIRTFNRRMEEEKQKHLNNSSEWMAMHHTQQDLDTLFKNLQIMLKVSDKHAPLT